MHSQRLPGCRRRVNAAPESLASWGSLNTRNLIILKRRPKVTLQALTLSTPLDPNSFSHYQKVMLFLDKQSISTGSKETPWKGAPSPRAQMIETLRTITQQLIRERAVWVDGGKFRRNVRPSDILDESNYCEQQHLKLSGTFRQLPGKLNGRFH